METRSGDGIASASSSTLLNSSGWCGGTSAMGVTGVAVKGAQLNARGSLGVEGQGLRAGESQGAATSLVKGKERPKWDWIQSKTNLMGQTEAGRGGGEGVKCRKVEGLRVGRSLEGSKLCNWVWVRGNGEDELRAQEEENESESGCRQTHCLQWEDLRVESSVGGNRAEQEQLIHKGQSPTVFAKRRVED